MLKTILAHAPVFRGWLVSILLVLLVLPSCAPRAVLPQPKVVQGVLDLGMPHKVP
jgi:hypothetical protein